MKSCFQLRWKPWGTENALDFTELMKEVFKGEGREEDEKENIIGATLSSVPYSRKPTYVVLEWNWRQFFTVHFPLEQPNANSIAKEIACFLNHLGFCKTSGASDSYNYVHIIATSIWCLDLKNGINVYQKPISHRFNNQSGSRNNILWAERCNSTQRCCQCFINWKSIDFNPFLASST